MTIVRQDLVNSYAEARAVLIPLTKSLRDPLVRLKIKKLNTTFKKTALWEEQKTGSGHTKFSHKVTRVIVEYQAHSSGSKDSCISPHIQAQILEQVQQHLNILHDDIFHYPEQGWKTPPNFTESLTRV